ncbi:sensor histidine kinase [Massilioclostridium coli]|uniref:sensor histidine kinase n=1 Tax=Massilioclostridium coli TaxID=1870991 RepID=UPI00085CBD41|nr:sensor histidine kinase [Massilioclostridium coli]
MKFTAYILDCFFSLICMLVAALLLFGLLWLIDIPVVFILLAEAIVVITFIVLLVYDFFRKRSYYNLLYKMMKQVDEKTLLGEFLTQPHFLEGQILVDILRRCNKYQNDQISDAKQANREYREYIDSWVHEIKTPITLARLMIENEKNPTTLRIDDELRKIDTYVEQVLYYARSTDVEKDFKVEKTTLQILVNAALKNYSKPLIQAGGKPVFCRLDIPVFADSKSCTFVIGQIISNAIKYRKDSLQIVFSGQKEKNAVILTISDNGIGILAADLPRIFDKGFTGYNGRHCSKSTGIGLYLSQKLCRKMNIYLSVSSVLGQGTTITMSFPTESYLQEAGV